MAEENKKPEAAKLNGASITITLQKSVIANGDEVMSLTFREPTGGDIERAGNPVLIDWSTDPPMARYDSKAMTQMMSLLAAVPPSTIRSMNSRDWETAAVQLQSFFLPELTSTD